MSVWYSASSPWISTGTPSGAVRLLRDLPVVARDRLERGGEIAPQLRKLGCQRQPLFSGVSRVCVIPALEKCSGEIVEQHRGLRVGFGCRREQEHLAIGV